MVKPLKTASSPSPLVCSWDGPVHQGQAEIMIVVIMITPITVPMLFVSGCLRMDMGRLWMFAVRSFCILNVCRFFPVVFGCMLCKPSAFQLLVGPY